MSLYVPAEYREEKNTKYIQREGKKPPQIWTEKTPYIVKCFKIQEIIFLTHFETLNLAVFLILGY